MEAEKSSLKYNSQLYPERRVTMEKLNSTERSEVVVIIMLRRIIINFCKRCFNLDVDCLRLVILAEVRLQDDKSSDQNLTAMSQETVLNRWLAINMIGMGAKLVAGFLTAHYWWLWLLTRFIIDSLVSVVKRAYLGRHEVVILDIQVLHRQSCGK